MPSSTRQWLRVHFPSTVSSKEPTDYMPYTHSQQSAEHIFILQWSISFPNSQKWLRWSRSVARYLFRKQRVNIRTQKEHRILRWDEKVMVSHLFCCCSILFSAIRHHGRRIWSAKVWWREPACRGKGQSCAPNWKHQFSAFNVAKRSTDNPKSYASKKIIQFGRAMRKWFDFVIASASLGRIAKIPVTDLHSSHHRQCHLVYSCQNDSHLIGVSHLCAVWCGFTVHTVSSILSTPFSIST